MTSFTRDNEGTLVGYGAATAVAVAGFVTCALVSPTAPIAILCGAAFTELTILTEMSVSEWLSDDEDDE